MPLLWCRYINRFRNAAPTSRQLRDRTSVGTNQTRGNFGGSHHPVDNQHQYWNIPHLKDKNLHHHQPRELSRKYVSLDRYYWTVCWSLIISPSFKKYLKYYAIIQWKMKFLVANKKSTVLKYSFVKTSDSLSVSYLQPCHLCSLFFCEWWPMVCCFCSMSVSLQYLHQHQLLSNQVIEQ